MYRWYALTVLMISPYTELPPQYWKCSTILHIRFLRVIFLNTSLLSTKYQVRVSEEVVIEAVPTPIYEDSRE